MSDLEFEVNLLEFEVHNQVLTRVDSQEIVNRNKNVYKCRFTFDEDSEWTDLNKFAIFTDGWGNSSTQHLGKEGNILSCKIPSKVLKGSYFKISVYGGKLITTNNISIMLIQSGYNRHHHYAPPHHHHPPHPQKPYLYKPHWHGHEWGDCCDEDIWVEVFDSLDNMIDSIIYDKSTLYLFSRDSLIESIYLPFVTMDEFPVLVEDLTKRFILENVPVASSENDGLLSSDDKIKLDSIEAGANKIIVDDSLDSESDNPLSNKCITNALGNKEDTYDFVERVDSLIQNLINEGE